MEYLIWDFDGTLGYREGGMWVGVLLDVIRQEAPERKITAERIRPYLQKGFPWHTPYEPHRDIKTPAEWWQRYTIIFEKAFKGLGFDNLQARMMARQVRYVYTDPQHWRLFQDTRPTLETLGAQGWSHAMLSNHVPELRDILDHLGLRPHFTHVFNSAETGYEKPHPQAFRQLHQTFPDATELWMIGDSLTADIAGAEALGIPGILARNYHKNARYYAEDLSSIPTILENVTHT